MKSLFKIGMEKKAFSSEEVLALIYGEVLHTWRTAPESRDEMFVIRRWNICRNDNKIFDVIPLKTRLQAIAPVIAYCKEKKFFEDFAVYALCALSGVLGNEAWTEESREDRGPVRLYDYEDGCDIKQQAAALTEIWIWHHLGVPFSYREKSLIDDCWQKILGSAEPKDKEQTKQLIAQKMPELKTAFKQAKEMFTRNYQKECELSQQFKKLKKNKQSDDNAQKLAELREQMINQTILVDKYINECNDLLAQIAFLKSRIAFEKLKEKGRI